MQEKKLNKSVLNEKLEKAPEVKEAVKDAAKAVEASAAKTVETVGAKAKEAGMAVAEKAEPVVKRRGRKPKDSNAASKKDKQQAKTEIVVQYQENAASVGEIEEKIREKFVAEGHRAGCIKTFNVYVKPEEYKAYYVINDKFFGSVDLF